jgi:hypothetical protein
LVASAAAGFAVVKVLERFPSLVHAAATNVSVLVVAAGVILFALAGLSSWISVKKCRKISKLEVKLEVSDACARSRVEDIKVMAQLLRERLQEET